MKVIVNISFIFNLVDPSYHVHNFVARNGDVPEMKKK